MWFVEKLGYCCGTPCSASELLQLEQQMLAASLRSNSTVHQWLPGIRAAAEAAVRAAEASAELHAHAESLGVQALLDAGYLEPVPSLTSKSLVTRLEFADKDCTDELFVQQHFSHCKLTNITLGNVTAEVRVRMACSNGDMPMSVYFAASDADCQTPMGAMPPILSSVRLSSHLDMTIRRIGGSHAQVVPRGHGLHVP